MAEYLTDDDYNTAELHGISRNLAYYRFYVRGWSKERTITKSKDRSRNGKWHQYKEQCEKNGISQKAFEGRIYRGMSMKLAASKPMQKRSK